MDRPGASGLTAASAAVVLALLAAYGPGLLPSQTSLSTLSQPGARAESTAPVLLARRHALAEVEFAAAGNALMSLRQFSGRVVVLSVWATWCAPCIREMPSLDALATKLPTVAVVPVNVDAKGLDGATAFLDKHGLRNLAPYHDASGRLLGMLNGRGLPTALIIDRDGKVAAIVEGAADWTAPQMLEVLQKI